MFAFSYIMNAKEIQKEWFCPFALKFMEDTKFSSGFFQDWSNVEKDSYAKEKSNIDENHIVSNQTYEEGKRKYPKERYQEENKIVFQNMINPIFFGLCVDVKDVLPEQVGFHRWNCNVETSEKYGN